MTLNDVNQEYIKGLHYLLMNIMGYVKSFNDSVRDVIRILTKSGMKILSKIMGVLLILYAFQVAYAHDMGNVDYGGGVYFAVAVMFVCGLLILLDFGNNLNRTIGLYAFGLGMNRALRYLSMILSSNGMRELFALVMFIIACNLIYTSICFLRGATRGRMNMILTSLLMALVSILTLIVMVKTMGYTIGSLYQSRPDLFILVILYFLLICMLTSDDVRKNDLNQIYVKNLESIRRTESYYPVTYVSQDVGNVLSKCMIDRSCWHNVNNGIVEEEFEFELIHAENDTSYALAQKRVDSDVIYFTIADAKDSTFLNAYRFASDDITVDDSNDLLIFGKNGEQIRIHIGEREVKKWKEKI